MDRGALDPPVAQRVAALRVLDLDDLGAVIGELQAQHVAGDEARQVDRADALERPVGIGCEGFADPVHGGRAYRAARPRPTSRDGYDNALRTAGTEPRRSALRASHSLRSSSVSMNCTSPPESSATGIPSR